MGWMSKPPPPPPPPTMDFTAPALFGALLITAYLLRSKKGGSGPRCSLCFSESSEGVFWVQWTKEPVDGALAYFFPYKTPAEHYFTTNLGKRELGRGMGTPRNAKPGGEFYCCWVSFLKEAHKYSGPVTCARAAAAAAARRSRARAAVPAAAPRRTRPTALARAAQLCRQRREAAGVDLPQQGGRGDAAERRQHVQPEGHQRRRRRAAAHEHRDRRRRADGGEALQGQVQEGGVDGPPREQRLRRPEARHGEAGHPPPLVDVRRRHDLALHPEASPMR